jgi:hypothetical protein
MTSAYFVFGLLAAGLLGARRDGRMTAQRAVRFQRFLHGSWRRTSSHLADCQSTVDALSRVRFRWSDPMPRQARTAFRQTCRVCRAG